MGDLLLTATTLYDDVLPPLLSAKFLLERLAKDEAQGTPRTERDAADLAAMIQHLATAAEVFHAWWMAHGHMLAPQGLASAPTEGGDDA